MLGPERTGDSRSAECPHAPAGVQVWIVGGIALGLAARAPVRLKVSGCDLIEHDAPLLRGEQGFLHHTHGTNVAVHHGGAGTRVAADPEAAAVIPVSFAHGLSRLFARLQSRSRH